jgi:hypothetical protein
VYDACPLNSGVLDFKIYVNGRDIFTRKDKTNEFDFYTEPNLTEDKEFMKKIEEMKTDKLNKTVKKSY